MNSLSRGFWAGVLATSAMTLEMFRFFHNLSPADQASPLPPAQLANDISKATKVIKHPSAEESMFMTMLSHFAYGAVCGMVYSQASKILRGSPVAKGTTFAMGVWGLSYMGWIPLFGLRPSAQRMSTKKNAMMISAHMVWGSTLGYAEEELKKFGNKLLDGRRRVPGRA